MFNVTAAASSTPSRVWAVERTEEDVGAADSWVRPDCRERRGVE